MKKNGLQMSVLALCMGCAAAHGQTATEPGAAPGTAQGTAPGAAYQLPDVDAILSGGTARTGSVREIRLSGNTVFSEAQLLEAVRPELGVEGDLVVLAESLRMALTRYYVDRGYVNSGVLLDGEVDAQGVLALRVVEGRLSELRITGEDGLSKGYVVRRLWPDADKVFNLNELQQNFQLLLRDPLFARVQSRVEPGERVGQALADIQIERNRAWSVYGGVDNYRSPASGEYQAVVGGSVRNLTGVGDALDVSLNSAGSSGTNGAALSYQLPIPGTLAVAGVSLTHGASQITQPPFDKLSLNNRSNSSGVSLQMPVYESPAHALTVGVEMQRRSSLSLQGGLATSLSVGEQNGHSKSDTTRVNATYSLRSDRFGAVLRLSHGSGRNNYMADPRLPKEADVPLGQFKVSLLQGVASYRFDGGSVLSLRGAAQWTPQVLMGMERYSPTGIQGVRGYIQNQVSFDNARTASLEWLLPLGGAEGWSVNVYPFVDWGQGKNNGVGPNSVATSQFMSYGLGLQGGWGRWSYAVTYASPQRLQDTITKGYLMSNGVQFSLRYTY